MSTATSIETWPRCCGGETGRVSIELLDYMEERIPRTRETLRHLVGMHAEPQNASRIGRKMGVSCHTILHRLSVLERCGVAACSSG